MGPPFIFNIYLALVKVNDRMFGVGGWKSSLLYCSSRSWCGCGGAGGPLPSFLFMPNHACYGAWTTTDVRMCESSEKPCWRLGSRWEYNTNLLLATRQAHDGAHFDVIKFIIYFYENYFFYFTCVNKEK